MGQYSVAGYGERSEYDGPYHPSAEFDPSVTFANAGDPKAAGKAAKAEHEAKVKAEEVETTPEPEVKTPETKKEDKK